MGKSAGLNDDDDDSESGDDMYDNQRYSVSHSETEGKVRHKVTGETNME